jgi:hypothetical protein
MLDVLGIEVFDMIDSNHNLNETLLIDLQLPGDPDFHIAISSAEP